jgi:type IV pilus assembly protein PilM
MYNNLFLNKETPLLAVDIGSRSITIAQLNVIDNECELVGIGVMPLPKGSVVDGLVENPDEVSDIIKKVIKREKFSSRYVVSSIPGDHGVIRKLTLSARNKEELLEELLPEVQHEIPFDIEDVRYDYHVIEKKENVLKSVRSGGGSEENNFDVIIAAVQEEIINNRLDTLVEAGLTPVVFELETFASVRSLEFSKGLSSTGPCVLFNLNDPNSHVSIVNNGQLAFNKRNPITNDCPTNWRQNTSRGFFKKANKIEDYFNNKFNKEFQSEEKMDTAMSLTGKEPDMDSVEKIIDEASEAIEIFSESTNEKVKCIFTHGIGALSNGIRRLLSEHFKIPVETINPFSSIKVDPRRFHLKELNDLGPQFAVVMGLALRRFDYK